MFTLDESGSWENARSQLLGKKAIRKGESPTLEIMVGLYTDFMDGGSRKKIRPASFATNVANLRRLMKRLKVETVAQIDFANFDWTDSNRKTTSSEIRKAKGIFKPAALTYYSSRGAKVDSPFVGVELDPLEITPYKPLPRSVRETITGGIEDLPSDQALALILCMKLGLRKSEADRARMEWIQEDMNGNFEFVIQKEDDFEPKTKHAVREIPIRAELVEEIRAAREAMNPAVFDPYIIAGGGRGKTRKDKTFRRLNVWLKSKGVKNVNPLHSMRKEWISYLVTVHGIEVAHKFAGHSDMNLTMKVYGGLTKKPVIDFR